MTFDPSNVLFSSQGLFLSNFVTIAHSWAIWPLADRCMTFDPSITLHFGQGFFFTKFSCHRTFLSNLTTGWPQLTPAWHLTPTIHYILVSGSSYQIWWPHGISKATWPLCDLWPLVESLRKYTSKPRGSVLYPCAKFNLDTSKQDETHSRIYIHTYIQTWMF